MMIGRQLKYVKYIVCLLCTFCIFSNSYAQQSATNLNELLRLIKQESRSELSLHRQREANFIAQKKQQKKLLADVTAQKKQLEQRSKQLSENFDKNTALINAKQQQLQKELGSIKELFGHLTAAAGDLRGQINQSLVSVQYPDRAVFFDQLIATMNSQTQIPDVDDINDLWFELQREIIETGRVVKLSANVTNLDGVTSVRDVVRIGVFNVISDGQFLQFDMDNQRLSVLPKQPAAVAGLLSSAAVASDGYTMVAIDPTGPSGGSYLNALIATPSLLERWHQGGIVGYCISTLGVIGFLLALWRWLGLFTTDRKVQHQTSIREPQKNNPLGRILAIADEHTHLDNESLELKMEEGILREKPRIEKGLNWLKIIYMVAPLLGLLGTVTGMIHTFQVITIFGAGDPQTMAGGISSALVTTVLGLIVAIPMVLLHTLVSSQARKILSVLEQQATGIVAENRESQV